MTVTLLGAGYSLAYTQELALVETKARCRERILVFLPDWKQSNLNARQNELNRIRFDRPWSAEEAAEVAAMEVLWGRAKALRAASDAHESAIMQLQSSQDVLDYDLGAGWPE